MGANLVGRAFAYAVDVPLQPNELRLLIGMCLTALDEDERPRYFDSREASALFLGRLAPDEGPERAAAFQAVKVAVSGLVKMKAIKTVVKGGNGRRANYELTLDRMLTLSTDEARRRLDRGRPVLPRRGRPVLRTGVGPSYQLGKAQPTDAVGPSYPQGVKEEKEPTKEPKKELQVTNASTSLGPVDNSRSAAA